MRVFISFLVFCFLVSCKSNKIITKESINQSTVIDEKLILLPIKIGLLNNRKEYLDKKYNIRFSNLIDENEESVYVNDELKFIISNDDSDFQKNYLFEVYNDNFLLISIYQNSGAASPELAERVKLFIVGLDSKVVYKVEPQRWFYLSMTNISNRNKSTFNNNFFSIQDIKNQKIYLESIHGKVFELEMEKLEGVVLIE